jgi:hypothetical protein
MFCVCVYMRYWAGLYPVVTKEVIEERVDLMLQTTIKLLGKKAKTARLTLAIEDKKTPDGAMTRMRDSHERSSWSTG